MRISCTRRCRPGPAPERRRWSRCSPAPAVDDQMRGLLRRQPPRSQANRLRTSISTRSAPARGRRRRRPGPSRAGRPGRAPGWRGCSLGESGLTQRHRPPGRTLVNRLPVFGQWCPCTGTNSSSAARFTSPRRSHLVRRRPQAYPHRAATTEMSAPRSSGSAGSLPGESSQSSRGGRGARGGSHSHCGGGRQPVACACCDRPARAGARQPTAQPDRGLARARADRRTDRSLPARSALRPPRAQPARPRRPPDARVAVNPSSSLPAPCRLARPATP